MTLQAACKAQNVLIGCYGKDLCRAVTHLDVSDADAVHAGRVISECMEHLLTATIEHGYL
jgi:hypothetical protein